ncbi:Kdo domain containing protein [Aureibaculum marinum]|uniref:Kdo domain containing protein n=1 Tax=Aureibaculum marinum TaxID=2487930 RepID=A0A3N4NRE1_9FLAO|nr:lipopolysaccharide kinase InaA family protein [Aureibaculum marinum]RPD98225.1 Kdo domain containing protein [Aureibaculum marinum]
MNFHINQQFKSLQTDLDEIISNFNSFDVGFGTGNRNSVKKIDLPTLKIVVKSFKIPILINQIVYKYFRKSKAKRSFEYANKLSELKINTPTPIAYLENFSWFGLQKSFYICEFLDYDLTYRELIHQPDYPNYENILKAFTRFTFELHQKGVLFLDHSPGNTLIVKDQNTYHFYLVDLNRMKFKELSFEERMKNFSRLTPKKEMIEIMSKEYAKLYNKPFDLVYEKMWFYTIKFQYKFYRKKRFKRWLKKSR